MKRLDVHRASILVAVALGASATTASGSFENPKHFVEPSAVPTYGPNNYVVTFDGSGEISSFGSPHVTGSTNLWTVGNNFTTKQEWTELNDTTVNTDPGTGFVHGPGSFTNPTLTVRGPGFATFSSNFYSFQGDYGADAIVANYGGPTGTVAGGTLLVMQTAAGINPDYRPVYNVGDVTLPATSTQFGEITPGALTITKANGSALPAPAQTLLFDKNFQQAQTPSPFGLVPYQELIWGIWLPGWTGDVNVGFEVPVHSMFSSMRVDTGIGSMNGTPSLANFVLGPPAVAVTLYWDINGTTAGAGGATPGGNWNGTTANFNTDPTGAAGGVLTAAPGAVDTVVFAAGTDATGNYTVNVSGTRTAANINFTEGNVTLTGGTLATGAFNVSAGAGGTVTSAIAAPSNTVTKSGVGTLQVGKLPQGHAVNINAGTVRVLESTQGLASGHPSGNNASLSRVSSLTIAAGATLDLTNNDLIIDYSGASPVAAIEALVASGYNVTGDWQGDGITSSVAALDGGYVVAIADNSALAAPFGTAQGGPLFSGVDVDLTTVLVKFTHRTDLNLDGLVTPDDSAIFGGNYDEGQPATWATGDLNYDGVFTPDDAAIFGGAFDESLASLPEPAGALSALALLATALTRRRSA